MHVSTERDGSGFTPEDLSFGDFSASLCTNELRQNGLFLLQSVCPHSCAGWPVGSLLLTIRGPHGFAFPLAVHCHLLDYYR